VIGSRRLTENCAVSGSGGARPPEAYAERVATTVDVGGTR